MVSTDPGRDDTSAPAERIPFPPPFLVPTVLVVAILMAVYFGYGAWKRRNARILSEACLTALDEEQWERAEQIGLRWLKTEPDNVRILVHLADAAKGQRAFERTVEYLLRVPDSAVEAPVMLSLAADLQFNQLVRPYDAEQTWLRLINIEPAANVPRKRLMFFYAMTLQRRKLYVQARGAIAQRCETPDAYAYLMLLYELRFTDAYPRLSAWLRANPRDEVLRVAQARALAEAPADIDPRFYAADGLKPGDWTLIERCMEDYPDNLELLAFQLETAIEQGDVQNVARLLDRAPAEAEHDPRFWRARGWSLLSGNRLEPAEEAYREALELYPLDWRARHELAQVLRRRQRVGEAEQLAELARIGKDLERETMELPGTSQIPPPLFRRMGEYARAAEVVDVAEAIEFRLGSGGDRPPPSRVPS